MDIKLKIAILSFLMVWGAQFLFAQNDNRAVVYLYDGSIYMGEVLSIEGNTIEMELSTNNTISFPRSRTRKLIYAKNALIFNNGKYLGRKGFFCGLNIGFNFGDVIADRDSSRRSEHIELLLGHKPNLRWAFGLGLGYEFNESRLAGFDVETEFSSLSLYGRYYITKTKARLFAHTRVGYGFGNDNEESADANQGGFQIYGGVGLHFASRKSTKFMLSLNAYVQKTNGVKFFLDHFGNEVITNYDIWVRRPILKLGVEFE